MWMLRIRWVRNIVRTDKERTLKRMTQWRSDALRRLGRPGLSWEGGVRAVLGKMKIQNWNKMAMDREA
jgi:hypothetical protein